MAEFVIFDCDGVLVDSEDVSRECTIATLKDYGINIKKQDLIEYTGVALHEIFQIISERFMVAIPVEEAVKRRTRMYVRLAKTRVHMFPEAILLLKALHEDGMKIAVASSGVLQKIKANLKEIDISKTFDAIVSGNEVEHSKPDPHIFLIAADKLGAQPGRCVVVEDSINGIRAAKDAGMKCIALETSFPRERLMEADLVVRDIGNISVKMLRKV